MIGSNCTFTSTGDYSCYPRRGEGFENIPVTKEVKTVSTVIQPRVALMKDGKVVGNVSLNNGNTMSRKEVLDKLQKTQWSSAKFSCNVKTTGQTSSSSTIQKTSSDVGYEMFLTNFEIVPLRNGPTFPSTSKDIYISLTRIFGSVVSLFTQKIRFALKRGSFLAIVDRGPYEYNVRYNGPVQGGDRIDNLEFGPPVHWDKDTGKTTYIGPYSYIEFNNALIAPLDQDYIPGQFYDLNFRIRYVGN